MEINTRWRKVINDLKSSYGRVLMMVAAIAVSVFGTAAIMSSYSIVTRESAINYKSTVPAAATIEMDNVDETLVSRMEKLPQIKSAEACSIINARLRSKKDGWMPVLLFVVPDFKAMKLNKIKSEKGAWPPPEGTVLVERNAMDVIKAELGESLTLRLPGGRVNETKISGVVHDPGLAPAWQEQTAPIYITANTYKMFGGKEGMHAVKISLKDEYAKKDDVEKNIAVLAQWLKLQGRTIEEIRITPPGKHPHQSQMNAVFFMLFIFGYMALALSGILSASMINAMLAQQVRQIGIMKTIGGRSAQISRMYLAQIILIGIVSVAIGLPLGLAAGRSFAGVIAGMLNIDLTSKIVPVWVYITQIIAGIGIPFFAALMPVQNAANMTVSSAVNDYGISRKDPGSARLDKLMAKLPVLNRTLAMAVRNVFRKKTRFFLTAGLLAAAGAMFMAGMNVKEAWKDLITKAASARTFNMEVRFNSQENKKRIESIIAAVPGVKAVESWNMVSAGPARADGLPVVRTYPDKGHGSLTLRIMPDLNSLVSVYVMQGEYPKMDEKGAVILNQGAAAFFPGIKAGMEIYLNAEGKPMKLKVSAILKEVLTPATAYVTENTMGNVRGKTAATNCVRIRTATNDKEENLKITDEVEQLLEKEKAGIKITVSAERLDNAQSGHVMVFITILIIMSVIMAITGVIGLMSSVSTSVIERTREIGIMRAIGARQKRIFILIISEGLFTGVLSWIMAIAASIPMSIITGNLFGRMSFGTELAPVLSRTGVLLWIGIIVIGSISASLIPAQKAANLTVRKTLGYY